MIVKPAGSGLIAQILGTGHSEDESSKIEPVLLIHGTFANKRVEDASDWWHPGSEFCGAVDALLQDEGSSARCWAHLEEGRAPARGAAVVRETGPFAWTGENSERDRRNAGLALAAELAGLENDDRVARYHLIGHSHGGNVILHALQAIAHPPDKLGAVVFMGTPVLLFRHREALDARWIAVPLYLAALAGSALAYLQWPGNETFWGTAAVTVLLVIFAELLRSGRSAKRFGAELYGSGRPSAFVFTDANGKPFDEAISALELAEGIVREPGRFIQQFVSAEPPLPLAYPATESPRSTFGTRIQGTGAYSLLQWLRPPQAVNSTRLLPPASMARDTFQAAVYQLPFAPIVIAILWICAAVPLLVMLAGASIYSFLTWGLGAIVAPVLARGAEWFGTISLPILVRKAAMGEDAGRFLGVRDLPPGVEETEPMSEALRDEAVLISHQLGQTSGRAMLDAVVLKDAFAIKSHVTNALSNAALAHSYYYRSREIRRQISTLIAKSPRSVVPSTPRLRFGKLMGLAGSHPDPKRPGRMENSTMGGPWGSS